MKLLLFALFMVLAGRAGADTDPVRVLVLGTYHFANPGQDLANARVDDVLHPRRQAELKAVAQGLLRFRPTMVAVERNADALPDHALKAFDDYLAGKGQDDRNEIVQIGYRLAHLAGLKQVVGIDAAGPFPFDAVQAWARTHGRMAELQHEVDVIQARVKDIEERQRTHTIGQMLRHFNHPATIREDNRFYMRMLGFGGGDRQPGAALLGAWTTRNLAICARLVQRARPGDRVVVVYGAGHSHALRQCIGDMPGWQLVEALEHLPAD